MTVRLAAVPVPFTIDIDRCTGCGRCVSACPARVLTLEVSGYRKYSAVAAPQDCTGCLLCLPACPVGAISAELYSL